MATMAANMQDS